MNIETLDNTINISWGIADQLYYGLPYPLSNYGLRDYGGKLITVKNNKDLLENDKFIKILRDNHVKGKVTYRQFAGEDFEYWGHEFDGSGGYTPLIGKATVKFDPDPNYNDLTDLKARRLVYKRGSSNKFWQVESTGKRVTRTYGRIGTDGQTTINDYGDADEARTIAEKFINEKLNEGYRFV